MNRGLAVTAALGLFGISSGAVGALAVYAIETWRASERESARTIYALDAARLLHQLSRHAARHTAADDGGGRRVELPSLQLDQALRTLSASPEVLILNSAAVLHGAEDITDLLLDRLLHGSALAPPVGLNASGASFSEPVFNPMQTPSQ